MVLNSSINDNGEDYIITSKVTDGAIRYFTTIDLKELDSLKTPAVSNILDYDFHQLIRETFLNDLPEKFSKSVELSAKQKDDTVTLHINFLFGDNIKNELISFKMESKENEESQDEEYDLFDWTKILSDDRDHYKRKYSELKAMEAKIKSDLSKSLVAQDELIHEAKAREEQQIIIFTKIINDFQAYNSKILSGEIVDEEDVFNLDKIRSLVTEVQDDAISPKKRKLYERLEHKEKNEKKPAKLKKTVKKESESPPPIKAELTDSVHFKFQDKDDETEDENIIVNDTSAEDLTAKKEPTEIDLDETENDEEVTQDEEETDFDTEAEVTQDEETEEETQDEELTEDEHS